MSRAEELRRCIHCGQSEGRLIALALAQALGARAYPSADECAEREPGKDHEFRAQEADHDR